MCSTVADRWKTSKRLVKVDFYVNLEFPLLQADWCVLIIWEAFTLI